VSELSLFAEPREAGSVPPLNEWTHIPKRTESAQLYNYAARRVINAPDGWQWFALKAIPVDCTLVTGDVPIGTKKNGSPKWGPEKNAQTFVLTPQMLKEVTAAWEGEHGVCASCGGDGMAWAGSSAMHGHKFTTCKPCAGTGLPPKARQGVGA
jgi:hypothetical protein